MSDEKMVTMNDVHEVTFEYLNKLTKMHNDFLRNRKNSEDCLVERVALFCAYSIIAGTFDVAKLSDDAEFISVVHEYINRVIPELKTGPITALPEAKTKVGLA